MECKQYENFQSTEQRNAYITALMDQHHYTLSLHARTLCAGTKVEPKELMQVFFTKMLENADQVYLGYKVQGKGVGYLKRMLKNALIDLLRRQKKTDDRKQGYQPAGRRRQLTPEEIAVGRQLRAYTDEQLKAEGFTEVDRAIFSLYLDGHGQAEIAKAWGMNANTVYTKIHRMRNFLRKNLKRTLT